KVAQILLMEEGGAREPFPALGRARVGEAADVALARRHVAFAAVCARVHPHPYTRFNVGLLKLQLAANVPGASLAPAPFHRRPRAGGSHLPATCVRRQRPTAPRSPPPRASASRTLKSRRTSCSAILYLSARRTTY